MPTTDYTEFLHNVKQEYITNSYELDGTFIFDIELPVTPHICPKCGETTERIKDYRIRTVKFGKVQRGPLIGKYRQRRYICPHCKHSFAENNPFVRKHMQLSVTNIRMLFDKLTETLTYTAIAKECDTSITTVLRYCSMITIPKPRTLPTVIGIDEFKGNAEGYQYQVNLTNPDTHEILDILPKRDTQALIRYFASFKHKDRVQVKFIVMDMSIQFKRIMEALFPHAHIICDRYHVCRLVDWAVERVRKREQHKLAAYSRMLKQNRRVLMKHPDHLTEAEHIKLCEILRISDDLRKAYALKLSFRKIFSIYGKQRIAAHLTHWLELVKASGLNEFNNFFTSFPAWMTQLTNAFLLPYSNGYTEGTNNKIKVLKRISYGLRHFGRFRVRILLLSKKNGTNHTYDWCQTRLVG